MRKSSQTPKQGNTLFNYFPKSNDNKETKSPISGKTNGGMTGSVGSDANDGNTTTSAIAGASGSQSSTSGVDSGGHELYDLVWAKLEGYLPYIHGINC